MTTKQIDLVIAGVTGKALPYSSCLNAMHEAEKTLKDTGAYSVQLIEIIRRDCTTPEGNVKDPFVASWYWHATAAQRAEAFLKTIGKWEDDK